jgi:hypothetical protein
MTKLAVSKNFETDFLLSFERPQNVLGFERVRRSVPPTFELRARNNSEGRGRMPV